MALEEAVEVLKLCILLKRREPRNVDAAAAVRESAQNADPSSPIHMVDIGGSQNLENGAATMQLGGSLVATVENEAYRGSRDLQNL